MSNSPPLIKKIFNYHTFDIEPEVLDKHKILLYIMLRGGAL